MQNKLFRDIATVAAAAASLTVAIAANPVFAADLPVKAIAAPAMAPVYNWAGFYAGVNGGYGWSNNGVDMDPNASPGALIRFNIGLFPASVGGAPRGGLGGVQFGYNFQSGTLVYGVEADLDLANIKGSGSVLTPLPVIGPGVSTTTAASKKISSFGTLRARIGSARFDRSLIYATGGLAYARTQLDTSLIASFGCGPVGICASDSTTSWRAGWTVGAGWEYAFAANWSGKVEYLYYDLGTQSHTFTDPTASSILFGSTTRLNGSIVRVGLNYLFK